MKFKTRQKGRKGERDKPLIKLPKSPAIMASGLSTSFLPSNPNELCDRLKSSIQEKQAGFNSNINNEEIVAIFGKLLEFECMSTKNSKSNF